MRWASRRRSLRGGLALLAVAVVALWLVILAVLVNVVLAARLRAQADSVLRTRAEAVAATVTVAHDGTVTEHDPPDDTALDAGIWLFAGTTTVERPAANGQLDRAAGRLAAGPERFAQVEVPRTVRLYALPVRANGRQVATVVAAVELTPYQRLGHAAAVASATLCLLLLAAVYAVTRLSVARALRPVAEMTEQAAQWSASDTDRRFGPGSRPEELEQLALRLDELLGRLSAVLRHEQQLTAELSHELRTPLARIIGEAELAARPGRDPAEMRAALTAVTTAGDQLRQVMDNLVTTARTDLGHVGRCDAATQTREVAAELSGARVRVVAEAPDTAPVGVAEDVLRRILAPLLDNAMRYAQTRVLLTVRPERDRVLVTVTDDGPGVATELAGRLFEPGATSSPAGTGLGLALARRLARSAGSDVAHIGTVRGACFQVTLPPG